jgi:hypothetical protein
MKRTTVLHRVLLCTALSIFFTLSTAAAAAAQVGTVDLDTVHAGPHAMGKMWTFEYPPMKYFTDTYGFSADSAWFHRIRLSVLRIPGCSASFVSGEGLVVTNHHCVRGAVARVTRPGETLLDSGFYAVTQDQERRIPGYYADRLIAVQDVSDEVFAAMDRASTDEERRDLRARAVDRIEKRLREQYDDGRSTIHVQVIPLYNGGRYSAYAFRRFTDVRLVAAAELQMGFFGGDSDNFTYPRYALDFGFLRVYDADGKPFHTDHWLAWRTKGVEQGDVVFVVGNPGRTSRLTTVAQLEYDRDVNVPAVVTALDERLQAMRAFYKADPETGEKLDLRNRAFSLSNSLKAYSGRLDALHDPVVMAIRRDIEGKFQAAVDADPDLKARYGDVVQKIADIQRQKRELAPRHAAFLLLGSSRGSSVTLIRATLAAQWLAARAAQAPSDAVDAIRTRLLAVGNQPRALEQALLAARFADFRRNLGPDDQLTRVALGGAAADHAAAALLDASVFADSARTAEAVRKDAVPDDDSALRVARVLLPRYADYSAHYNRLSSAERDLAEDLGRARFAIYGTAMPPDGSSSPRITDGVVLPYAYNGTTAPVYTTFYGMYDRFNAFGPDSEWNLPLRWRTPPPGLDLGTPLNFISTADTYGGNSGSPAITPDLHIVGLNFDRNIEGLSRDYVYTLRGRNIMVDVRAVMAALRNVYHADRLVQELKRQAGAGAGG